MDGRNFIHFPCFVAWQARSPMENPIPRDDHNIQDFLKNKEEINSFVYTREWCWGPEDEKMKGSHWDLSVFFSVKSIKFLENQYFSTLYNLIHETSKFQLCHLCMELRWRKAIENKPRDWEFYKAPSLLQHSLDPPFHSSPAKQNSNWLRKMLENWTIRAKCCFLTYNIFFCSSSQSSSAFTTNQEHLKSSISVPIWKCNNRSIYISFSPKGPRFVLPTFQWVDRWSLPYQSPRVHRNNPDNHPKQVISKLSIDNHILPRKVFKEKKL